MLAKSSNVYSDYFRDIAAKISYISGKISH